MNTNVVRVTVRNWERFNPRSDRANYSWFRFQNGFFTDQSVFGLSDAQQLLFAFLCCEASKKNEQTIDLRMDYICALRKKSEQEVRNDLKSLAVGGLIAGEEPAESRHEAGSEPALLPATYVRTNERNERDGTDKIATPRGILVELWQKHSGTLEKVTSVSPTRATQIRERLEENPDPAYWEGLIKKMAASPFFNGQNKFGWAATFGWLIKPGKHEDVAEGTYDSGIETGIDWEKLK